MKSIVNFRNLVLFTALTVAGSATVARGQSAFPSVPGLFVYDAATGQSNSVALSGGIAQFSGTLGDYTVDIVATLIASGSAPVLDLNVLSATANAGATTFDAYFSDGPFGPTSSTYILETTDLITGGPVVSSAGNSGTVFGNSQNLGGSTDAYPFVINATGSISGSSYYLTSQDLIEGSISGLDSRLTVVPEPANLLTEALILLPLGIGALRYWRKRRTA